MLYTRKGDDGTTVMFACAQRVPKSSPLCEALGAVDELNAWLGLCAVKAEEASVFILIPDVVSEHMGDVKLHVTRAGEEQKQSILCVDVIQRAQHVLFIVQAELAGAAKTVDLSHVREVERIIDILEVLLPPITSFSLAGGIELSALCDVARTFARRAERRVLIASEMGDVTVGEHTKAYLNRLSSVMFALARFINHQAGVLEQAPEYR